MVDGSLRATWAESQVVSLLMILNAVSIVVATSAGAEALVTASVDPSDKLFKFSSMSARYARLLAFVIA